MKLTKLKSWRQVRGMSQEELARRASLSHAAISRIECGAGCTPATARKLAYALNLEIPDLVANPPQRAYATA